MTSHSEQNRCHVYLLVVSLGIQRHYFHSGTVLEHSPVGVKQRRRTAAGIECHDDAALVVEDANGAFQGDVDADAVVQSKRYDAVRRDRRAAENGFVLPRFLMMTRSILMLGPFQQRAFVGKDLQL